LNEYEVEAKMRITMEDKRDPGKAMMGYGG